MVSKFLVKGKNITRKKIIPKIKAKISEIIESKTNKNNKAIVP